MQITFNLPHVFFPGSPREEDADALKALLECLIQLDLIYRRDHPTVSLYHSRVVYARTEIWDTTPALFDRGYGDCKSLTADVIAMYRLQGKAARPVFRWYDTPDGAKHFHILVQTQDGFEDPSKDRGMGKDQLW